jgi:ATP-dependent Clp protease ATP-binding subunit ClpA
VRVVLDDAARAWLAVRGFDRLFGARPMARLIGSKIREPLAEELLFGQSLMSGGEVAVGVAGDELTLNFPHS